MTEEPHGPPRCQGQVRHRDTYRRTGRGRTGFTMHYIVEQCPKRAVVGDFCRAHVKWHDNPLRCRWASPFLPATFGKRRAR